MLNSPFYGMADDLIIGNIFFFPNAFLNKEELTRTLIHEKIHVEQFKEYGAQYVRAHPEIFEPLAYSAEDELIEKLRKDGIL